MLRSAKFLPVDVSEVVEDMPEKGSLRTFEEINTLFINENPLTKKSKSNPLKITVSDETFCIFITS